MKLIHLNKLVKVKIYVLISKMRISRSIKNFFQFSITKIVKLKHSLTKDNVFSGMLKKRLLKFLFKNLDKRKCVTILVMVI